MVCLKLPQKTIPQNEVRNLFQFENVVGIITEIHLKIKSGPRKIRFYSLGWPTEKQSTLAGLPPSRCKIKPHPEKI